MKGIKILDCLKVAKDKICFKGEKIQVKPRRSLIFRLRADKKSPAELVKKVGVVGFFQLGTWVNDMSEVGGGTRTEIDVKRDPSSLS